MAPDQNRTERESVDQHRAMVTGATRVVVKIGSSSLTSPGGGLDPACVTALVDALATRTLAPKNKTYMKASARRAKRM